MLEMTINFSDNFHVLHTFHLKFTINANIVYFRYKIQHVIECPNHHHQYFQQLLYDFVYCVATYLI